MSLQKSDRWQYIGQLRKSYGKDGALRCFIEEPFEIQFLNDAFIYVDLKGDMVPYFFSSRDGEEKHYVIKFDDVNTPEHAKQLAGLDVYFLKEDLTAKTIANIKKEEEQDPRRLVGWTMMDVNTENSYAIVNIEEFPHQTMLTVESESSEHYVPLVDEWIKDIDPEKTTVYFNLPEGLIE